jgi:hypothetical protein
MAQVHSMCKALGRPQTSTSACWVSGITGVHYHTQLGFQILNEHCILGWSCCNNDFNILLNPVR